MNANEPVGREVEVVVVDGVLLIDGVPSCPACMDPTPCEQKCFASRKQIEIVHEAPERVKRIRWVTR